MKLKTIFLLGILSLNIIPAFAQDATPESDAGQIVSHDGFSFSLDPAVASGVEIVPFAGDDPAEAAATPGGGDAPYFEFLFTGGDSAPESLFEHGGVRVYHFADMVSYRQIVEQVNALGSFLTTQPDLANYMVTAPNAQNFVLPFLPVLPTAQVIRARAQYVETEAVSGMSYITVYRQDASPFVGSEFLYTFQGISIENETYVSAVFRLTTDLFPAETPADFDFDPFIAGIQTYFADSIATLNAAASADFTPSLDTLDALIESITFAG